MHVFHLVTSEHGTLSRYSSSFYFTLSFLIGCGMPCDVMATRYDRKSREENVQLHRICEKKFSLFTNLNMEDTNFSTNHMVVKFHMVISQKRRVQKKKNKRERFTLA
ncbi:uncharacterized protein LOC143782664 isoform X2 [Ranitomeya variabilis]|uniref:uncharacterized protein LOC143782664 isoform X2 n=1 Tax=Ranitomeya variabilis TaxID=490064 RepID=UPI00405778E2